MIYFISFLTEGKFNPVASPPLMILTLIFYHQLGFEFKKGRVKLPDL